MSMMVKYKLSEVAKDFGLQNKEIADILKQVLDVSRSNSRALDEQELNVIFETLTQNRQVEDFAAVFKAMDEQKQAEKAAAEAAKKAEQEAAEAARRAEQEKKEAEEKKRQEAARKNDGGKKPEQPRQGEKKPEPQKNQTQQPQQQSQKGPKVRYVDTRGSSVNLEKYDERLDTLAPEDTDKMQSKAGKQKIKQNQQKRSQYGGSKRREPLSPERDALVENVLRRVANR